VFMRDLALPRGPKREVVHDVRDRGYTLRGSETRTLSTVGAFRVVSARHLRDHHGGPADVRSGGRAAASRSVVGSCRTVLAHFTTSAARRRASRL
jgi:hypothetical protein